MAPLGDGDFDASERIFLKGEGVLCKKGPQSAAFCSLCGPFGSSEQRDATGARQAAPLRHSLLSASTGSFLLAALEGMRPAKNVRNMLIPTSTRAACHGSNATFATLNSA